MVAPLTYMYGRRQVQASGGFAWLVWLGASRVIMGHNRAMGFRPSALGFGWG